MSKTTYTTLIEVAEAAALAVNPSGTFLHGTYLDLRVKTDLITPLIQLLMPFVITEANNGNSGSAELVFFFGQPDTFDSDEMQRQQYVDAMMQLSYIFEDAFRNQSGLVAITTDVRREMLYKVATDLTGVGMLFTATVTGC